ncbi:MAG: hypothetical protein PSY14_15990 [bacterium]|nr:hypothetical protein [bacterium]
MAKLETYTAKRTALNAYAISAVDGRVVMTSSFTDKFAVWTAEGAPMASAMRGLNLEAFPQLTINGAPCIARQRLMTNKLFYNTYQIWLEGAGDAIAEKVIQVELNQAKWRNTITYQGKAYWFRRRSLFTFDYSLEDESGKELAHFSETTPFLTFSVRKTYKLLTYTPLDETLVAFAFFLAAGISY